MAPASPDSTLFAAPPGHLTLIMASRRTASFRASLLLDLSSSRTLWILIFPSSQVPLEPSCLSHSSPSLPPAVRLTPDLPSDPRFSFYLYVPRAHPVTRRSRGEDIGPDGNIVGPPVPISTSPTSVITPSVPPPKRGFPLLAVMHDSSRDAEKLRDHWAEMAEEEGVVVLSPHFPCDLKVGSVSWAYQGFSVWGGSAEGANVGGGRGQQRGRT